MSRELIISEPGSVAVCGIRRTMASSSLSLGLSFRYTRATRLGVYCRWKSLGRGGRPQIETELRALIRRMIIENPLWGAPRIHGELLKLGFAVPQPGVPNSMVN